MTINPTIIPQIYVAGPYSADAPYKTTRFIDRARIYAQEIALMGASPVSIHLLASGMDGTQSYEWWSEAYMQLMRRCDAVFMLPRWEHSNGSRREHAEADRLSMPVFYHLNELKTWLTGVGPTNVDSNNEHVTPYE